VISIGIGVSAPLDVGWGASDIINVKDPSASLVCVAADWTIILSGSPKFEVDLRKTLIVQSVWLNPSSWLIEESSDVSLSWSRVMCHKACSDLVTIDSNDSCRKR